ncbi:MAG: PEGA domain-containing protein [Deltaproteobacteria bacterium]|nr:PEGA domain-containing protein [Deltaproteobacteria bacterium]
MPWRIIAVLTFVQLIAPAKGFATAERARAEALFRQANSLFAAQRYKQALDQFRAAQALVDNYRLDLNIARTLDKLDRPLQAHQAYNRFLERVPQSVSPAIVSAARERAQSLAKRLARVQISCNVDAATVWIGEQQVARTPLKMLWLLPGHAKLVIRAPGYQDATIERRLVTERLNSIAVTLRRRAVAAKSIVLAPQLPTASQPDRRRQWRWIALGVGASLVAGAAVTYGLGISRGNAAHNKYLTATDFDTIARHRSEVISAERTIAAGHVLAGLATIALGTSLYLWLSSSPAERHAVGALTLLRDGALVGASGSF